MNLQDYAKSFIPHLEKRYKVNLSNPRTLNDKLNWLKVYDCTPLKSFCADKITLRRYLEYKLPNTLYDTIPIIKTYERASDINFDELPHKCVFKCNHGSSYNIAYEKGTNSEASVISKLNEWMKVDYGNEHQQVELHYDFIPKRILVEPFVNIKTDYKFWCFNGVPKFFVVVEDNGPMNYFSVEPDTLGIRCTPLNIARKGHLPLIKVDLIESNYIRYMYDRAKILCEDFKFVRVDFSVGVISHNIYITELTFIPGSGCIHYTNPTTDLELGKLLQL